MPTFPTTVIFIENFNTVFGILIISLLVYVIRRFSGLQLGAYKHLLTTFALTGIFLLLLHWLVSARTILIGTIHGIVTDCSFCDRKVTAAFLALQSIPFELLVIHFLYRYWSVRRPHLIPLFSRGRFVIALLLMVTAGIMPCPFFWYFIPLYGSSGEEDTAARSMLMNEYERKFGKRIENAWIVYDHWPGGIFDLNLFITKLVLNVTMIFAMVVASTLAFLTFHHIKCSNKMSAQAHKLQRKLLIALCVQASIPGFCVCIPYLMTFNFPLLKLSITIVHDSCVLLTTAYPVVDALAIILLITDYRQGIMRMLRRQTTGQNHAQTSNYVSSEVSNTVTETLT